MTDTRLTQAAVEQWAGGSPQVQLTQAAVEQWASATTTTVQTVLTQIAVEQWASVVPTGGAVTPAMVMVLA